MDRPGGNRQPDLLVRATNTLDPNRIAARIWTEVASLLSGVFRPNCIELPAA